MSRYGDADYDDVSYEKYALTLTHDIVSGDDKVRVEDPIRVEYCIAYTPSMGGKSVIVNEMLRRLSAYLLDALRHDEPYEGGEG